VTRTSRAKRKRLTTRNDETPVPGQGCPVARFAADLRHAAVIGGCAFDAGVKVVGHSSFTLTLDVYGDYIPKDDGGAVNPLPEPAAPAKPTERSRPPSNVISLFGRQAN